MEISSQIALLNAPLPYWETFIAVNLVIDTMLANFLAAARESSFSQLAQRARKIPQEERSHRTHAAAWTRRLARDDASRERLATAIATCWEQVAGWPGSDGDYAELVAAGLLTGSPDDLRSCVRIEVATALRETGESITLP